MASLHPSGSPTGCSQLKAAPGRLAGFRSSRAVSLRPSSVPCLQRASASKTEVTVFGNLTVEMASDTPARSYLLQASPRSCPL